MDAPLGLGKWMGHVLEQAHLQGRDLDETEVGEGEDLAEVVLFYKLMNFIRCHELPES